MTGDLHEAEEVAQEAFVRASVRWSWLRDYNAAVSVETLTLAEALRTLPIRQRQAIVLHHLVDLPVEEVAQTLRIPAGTVKSLLSRGRRGSRPQPHPRI